MRALTTLGVLLRAMRPHQWVKNLFVLAPVVFGGHLLHPGPMALALLAFLLFCLLSGAVYLMNDTADREADRLHPLKRHRPIAAGLLSVRTAMWAVVVIVGTTLPTAYIISPWLALVAAGYFALNVAYSFVLKHVVFVDIVSIAAGFILRILGGAVAVRVPISPWLVLCTFLLALFLGMGKRKHERLVGGETGNLRRRVLAHYKVSHLNMALNITAAVTIFSYLLYTTSERTIRVFGTSNLVFTVPFIVFGLIRFMQIVETHREEESPTDYIVKDIPFVANLLLWAATIVVVIYVL